MKFLTRQEQWFLVIVVGLLMVGWCVKWYRTAHPAAQAGPSTPALSVEQ